MNTFLTFSLRQTFYRTAARNVQNLKISTITTLNKTCKTHEKNNASQTCQDESGLLKVLNTEHKKNKTFNSTENLYNCEKEGNALKGNNIASQIRVRLEGKLLSKNIINPSRRNLSTSEISLLSEGLKFEPTANKVDRKKLKTIRRLWKGTMAYVAF